MRLPRLYPMLVLALLVSSVFLLSVLTVAAQTTGLPGEARHHESSPGPTGTLATAQPMTVSKTVSSDRAAMMYRRLWGVDDIKLKATASGSLIRFSFRVLDANRAAVLNEKKFTPILTDETTGAKLEVPTMEKVGQLRQTATPRNGREYWMVFLNTGHQVKRGSHVSVAIGDFRVSGLVVE